MDLTDNIKIMPFRKSHFTVRNQIIYTIEVIYPHASESKLQT